MLCIRSSCTSSETYDELCIIFVMLQYLKNMLHFMCSLVIMYHNWRVKLSDTLCYVMPCNMMCDVICDVVANYGQCCMCKYGGWHEHDPSDMIPKQACACNVTFGSVKGNVCVRLSSVVIPLSALGGNAAGSLSCSLRHIYTCKYECHAFSINSYSHIRRLIGIQESACI